MFLVRESADLGQGFEWGFFCGGGLDTGEVEGGISFFFFLLID